MNRYAVILAGGAGTRFWPLSRRREPKQFLRLFSEKTLFEMTVERIRGLIPAERILVCCNAGYRDIVRRLMPDLPAENLIGEPAGRNTAPCIALAALLLAARDPGSSMCVLPSDHHIADSNRFLKLMDAALKGAETLDLLLTFGIIPTSPHTGFGYIRTGDTRATIDGVALLAAEQFVEKPHPVLAEEYLSQGNYYWNSGMFAWKTSTILEQFDRWLPEVLRPLQEHLASAGTTDPEEPRFAHAFSRLPSISIDYGVMEKSKEVALVRGDFGWNDVGSWDALEALMPLENGNLTVGGDIVMHDSKRCIAVSRDKLVACLGVENLIVVATGDAVLVARKDRAQDLRLIVQKLRDEQKDQYL